MSYGLQRAEVSSPASRIRGSTESANTPCPADGLAYALSTPPIISIAGTNARILSHSFALPLHNPTVLDFRSSANRGACTPSAEERNARGYVFAMRPGQSRGMVLASRGCLSQDSVDERGDRSSRRANVSFHACGLT